MVISRFLVSALLTSWMIAPALAADAPLATPVDGAPFQARLAGATPDGQLRFAEGDNARQLTAADLVTWGTFAEATRGPQLLLSSGGVIVAGIISVDRQQLVAAADLAGEIRVPLAMLTGIVFRPPHDRYRRDQLNEKVLAVKRDTDVMILDNGDELTGTITGLHDDALSLETRSGNVGIDVSRISAVIFNPALVDKPPSAGLRILVGLRDGSRLVARSLNAADEEADLKFVGGMSLKVKLSDIVALQPLGGRVVYLSDLPVDSYRHIPYLSLTWPYQINRNVRGSQLRVGKKIYTKGLGVHSACRLTYALDRDYQRFEGEVGIDDQTAGRGSVIFRVFVDDGDGAWQPRYASPIVRGGDAPTPFSVDLAGAKRMSLLVDFADHGDELDYANWLNTRLVK